MTAEVSVMNRLGVAIAADSAVTIGGDNNSKTYYTAQKIFHLSKRHSVGMMINGSSEFMDVAWEIIFNEYSKALGDRVFDTLEEYVSYFLVFLRDFIHIDAFQKIFLEIVSYRFFTWFKKIYNDKLSEKKKNRELTREQKNKIFADLLKERKDAIEKETYSTGYVDDGFVDSNRAIISKELEEVFSGFNLSEKTKADIFNLFIMDIDKLYSGSWHQNSSGIVFAGYGEKEIFPSIIDFDLIGKLGKSVLHTRVEIRNVTDDSNSWICPYAQPNVINSFIRGMDPEFREMIDDELDALIGNAEGFAGKKNTGKFISVIKELKDKIQSYQDDNYKNPVMEIVSSLPKSNLAEMAEALVNLTGLRQHVSTAQETVGGPTDVALITKKDGFVWIRKKQIFHSVNEN